MCVLKELHIVVNTALLNYAVQYFILYVLVLNVWNQHILTQNKTHIGHIHYHHIYFLFSYFIIISNVKNLKQVFIQVCWGGTAKLLQSLNEVFECYIILLRAINISHKFVQSVTPKSLKIYVKHLNYFLLEQDKI